MAVSLSRFIMKIHSIPEMYPMTQVLLMAASFLEVSWSSSVSTSSPGRCTYLVQEQVQVPGAGAGAGAGADAGAGAGAA